MSSDSKFEVFTNCNKRVNQSNLYFFRKGSRREIKTRGNDKQRVNALEELKRARQGGQAAIVEQVKAFI